VPPLRIATTGPPSRPRAAPRLEATALLTARPLFVTFGNVKSTVGARARHAPDDEGNCAVSYVDVRKVAAVRKAAPPDDDVTRVAERFSALSDPTRVRLLDALSRAELCVCDLSKIAGRSMPATSQQLQLLRRLGLVKFRMDGKLAYYSVADEWVRDTLGIALADRRGGSR